MNITLQPLSENIGLQIINNDNISILELNLEEITNLFKSYGVLLFRGFETNTNIFKQFSNLLSVDFLDYTGGAFTRRIIDGDKTVLSVNDYQFAIKLHGEMYYQKSKPLMLWFFCATPASQGGETTICDGKYFFEELSDSTKNLFSRNKLKFSVYQSKDVWQAKYKTDDLDKLQEICKNNDISLKINADKSIYLEYIFSAIIPSKCGKYQIFINSILPTKQLNPEILKFVDDSEIPNDVLQELDEVAERVTTNISWEKGDILMIDNTRVMHGRRAFSDEKRDIYIRLCSPAFEFSSTDDVEIPV
ncbi:TauD/TfdA family dioxygenase [Nostoc sp. FACHB-152]|uniref:TauD/TfdA family dioxygenase n=1 Tax=unclassified Nostoc TaxID=2593658 RepID=UPI0016877B07|nr:MULTISPECIES: TauD/TfdA family dioxygenase [unclassified Nostoc]MBD2451601.1 TauD/TfdA family dioxygenase [Nostoc sp. FACHB-152]MBD2472058.1 TauD/TfdA family dioxygenase [Nostoc sp. FACHB-145]